MTRGRPSLFNDEMLEKAEAYLTDFEHDGDVVPTLAGLADYIGVCRDTVYDWITNKEDFSYITRQVMSKQERKLVNRGLTGEFNPAVTKMLLGKHGYSEKTETDVTSKGESINNFKIYPTSTLPPKDEA